jgi:hypothetical protein
MKLLAIITFLLSLALVGASQTPKEKQPPFDNAEFSKKFDTVQWLLEYDNVAWKTTDVVMALPKEQLSGLGHEWFCFQDKNRLWHAVYGKLAGGKYEMAFHYEMDSAEKIKRSTEKIDQDFLNRHALALKTASDKLAATIPPGSPTFNQFVRLNADKTFSVWLFPAFQPDRLAVYGGEGVYTIDAAGKKIVKDESYFQVAFRGLKTEPPREVWLDYSEMDKPTLGAIFFVWYYKSYFTKIFIDNEKTTSTVAKTGNQYVWIHVVKDEEK